MNSMMTTLMGSQIFSKLGSSNDSDIFTMLFTLLMVQITNMLPMLIKGIGSKINEYLKHKSEQLIQNTTKTFLEEKKIVSSIRFKKLRNKNASENKTVNTNTIDELLINSINNYICNINNSKYLTFSKDFKVTYDEEFEIAPNIHCKVKILSDETPDEEASYTIDIYSYTLKLEELKDFVEKIKRKYLYEQNNKLGNQKYYFDEKAIPIMKNMDGTIRYDTASSNLLFTMSPFNTNKSLANVFGKHVDELKNRINLFVNNPEWYSEKGIPYTLGILLHGPPGTGKTSIIKAIAKDCKRHIINIKLSEYTTQTQLKNLFYKETIQILNDGKNEYYTIPLDERIYCIEDIDCLTDVVLSRDLEKEINKEIDSEDEIEQPQPITNIPSPINLGGFASPFAPPVSMNPNYDIKKITKKKKNDNNDTENGEKLTLSFLLNLLDGILETPGRILIITSNYPERLDNAFIRPGRIDINLKVGYCDKDMINEMAQFFYNNNKINLTDLQYNNPITPAELNKILLNNLSSFDKFKNELIELVV